MKYNVNIYVQMYVYKKSPVYISTYFKKDPSDFVVVFIKVLSEILKSLFNFKVCVFNFLSDFWRLSCEPNEVARMII